MASDAEKRRLIFSICKFLQREMDSDGHGDDAKESLEVASQCLQTAFTLNALEDNHLDVSRTLEDIFKEATSAEPMKKKSPPPEEQKAEAEKLKLEGNDLMRAEKFQEAVDKYTKAIELDQSNQVFYCNRAAAHSKMNNHYAAVEDCRRAIDMDPSYSKAYGRMGLAYSSVEKHKDAVDCFKKALELEPDNESYKSNLQLAREKLESAPQQQQQTPPAMGGLPFPGMMGGGPGGMDFSAMLNNPALMNMATSLMSDPNMQNMMGQLMSGGMNQGGGGGGGGSSMEGLIQAGQRLAEQMQSSNPELVESLRRQMGGGSQDGEDGGNNEDGGNDPDRSSSS